MATQRGAAPARRSAGFKVQVAIRFVTETVPRNANGKILKRKLRGLFGESVIAT